jgi:hypothetical protein
MDSKRLTPKELALLSDEQPVSILPPDFVQTPYVPKEAKR